MRLKGVYMILQYNGNSVLIYQVIQKLLMGSCFVLVIRGCHVCDDLSTRNLFKYQISKAASHKS